MANYDLDRFLKGQARNYDAALREIREGCKRSHWMWYVFPQIQGLGYSSTAQYYAIRDLCEAKAYLQHPILRERLLEISNALLALDSHNASEVFGWPDDMNRPKTQKPPFQWNSGPSFASGHAENCSAAVCARIPTCKVSMHGEPSA